MVLPSTNTNNILVTASGSISTPAAGYVTYFFNTADGNKLYYKSDDGTIHLSEGVVDGMSDCVCKLLCGTASTWNKALIAGILTPAEYTTLLTGGFQVSVAGTVYSISNIV